MISSFAHPLLRPVIQGLAVGALLGGMALMAFAAGLVLVGAMLALPIAVGFAGARQFIRGGPKASEGAESVIAPAAALSE
jgi:Na+/H+-translocating membrane pyrophosphatase